MAFRVVRKKYLLLENLQTIILLCGLMCYDTVSTKTLVILSGLWDKTSGIKQESYWIRIFKNIINLKQNILTYFIMLRMSVCCIDT